MRGWPARVHPPRRAGGMGARVQGRSRRPQAGPGLCKASAGAGAAWAVVARRVRCTSGRSASAACGARGVRAAQQKGSRQRSDSSKQAKRLEHHDVVYIKSHDVVRVIHVCWPCGQLLELMKWCASRSCDRDDEPWCALGIRSR